MGNEKTYCMPLPGGVTVTLVFSGPVEAKHFAFLRQYLDVATQAIDACCCDDAGWRHCQVHQNDGRDPAPEPQREEE